MKREPGEKSNERDIGSPVRPTLVFTHTHTHTDTHTATERDESELMIRTAEATTC